MIRVNASCLGFWLRARASLELKEYFVKDVLAFLPSYSVQGYIQFVISVYLYIR